MPLKQMHPAEADEFVEQRTLQEAKELLYGWYDYWARPKQHPPQWDWLTWFILAGRGWGKTRTGAEWIRHRVQTGQARRIALVAPTSADARDVMIEGESGLLNICPPHEQPEFEPSKRRLTWYDANGQEQAVAIYYSAEEPARLNGPQHDTIWHDELGVWKYARKTWDMAQMGLRLGDSRQVITTTPKVQNITLIKEILNRDSTAAVYGDTYENREHLSRAFFEQVIGKYEGTRLGKQELFAKILDELPGALWNRELLEQCRVQQAPELARIVVSIDPAVTSSEESDETGITVEGIDARGHGYVLQDLTRKASPSKWAKAAIAAYHWWAADRIVAETNNGGDLVEETIRSVDPSVPVKQVKASRGKYKRAEPIASLYEQQKVHHVGFFDALEDQQCAFLPEETDQSPDRVDAVVWGLTELLLPERTRKKAGTW